MSDKTELTLEILSGPLDGATVTLAEETAWSSTGEGALVFPWDEELGQPQGHFIPGEAGWQLQVLASPHGTYRLNQGERLSEGSMQLAEGDILKASDTWLLISSIDPILTTLLEAKEKKQ